MTSITPPDNMPFSFDEERVSRDGSHGYDMGKSPSQHAYVEGTRLAKVWTRGWYSRKASFEHKD